MKPLIVLATDSPDPSGLGEHMLTLAQELAGRFEIVIAGDDRPGGLALLTRAARRGLRVKSFATDRLGQFRDWLARSGVGLLHVHAGIGWEGHDLVRAGKAAGLPVVRTEHLPYLLTSAVQQAEHRAMLQSVDRLIAVSHAVVQSHAARSLPGMAVVLNGISTPPAMHDRRETRARLGLGEADPIVLTVARLTPQKGHDVLLAAIPDILLRHPRTRFLLVGEGPELANLAAMIDAADLSASVLLLGQRNNIPDLLSAADYFVLPSRFEGLSLAVLEAMAVGLPIIATAIGGTVEALGRDHTFLVPPADPQALSSAIIRALGNPDAAAAVGAASKARFLNQFTADRMARQTADLYAPLLSKAS